MLSVKNLRIENRNQVILDNVDVELVRGRLVAICGPNGAGKSSLMRCLAGLDKPTAGSITLKDRPINEYSSAELANTRSWLAQQTTLSSAVSAAEVLWLSGQQPTAPECESYGIHAMLNRSYDSLSGGEQQRVQLLRTKLQLARKSQTCWLLDEPTANLDIAWQHRLLADMKRYSEEGHLVVAVLHDLQLAAQYADDCLLLGENQLLAKGTIHDVFTTERLSDLYQYPVQVLCSEQGDIEIRTSAYERT